MDDHSHVTIRPPAPRIVHVSVIDADASFCALLDEYLTQRCLGTAKLVAVYNEVPSDERDLLHTDVLIFNPELPEFIEVDGIDRVQKLFGQNVVLIARLATDVKQERLDDLEASGVNIGVMENDFGSIVSHLNQASITGNTMRSATESGTSITPLRPLPIQVTLSIIDADRSFEDCLIGWFKQQLPGIVQIEQTYEEIPRPSDVHHVTRAVIFDPEMDDFRRLAPALTRMREAFGEEAIFIAHVNVWNPNSTLQRELRNSGVRIGICRNDFKAFLRLVELLSHQEPLDVIVKEFGT
ncbi:MAG: hypothetical protein WCK01_02355 [Candidatus Uhrbacteria bacterium]